MAKKLWNVTVEYDVVVYAEDEDDANDLAFDAIRDGDADGAANATPMRYMPGWWDEDALPFSGADDIETVGALIKAGAAPEYKANARKVRL